MYKHIKYSMDNSSSSEFQGQKAAPYQNCAKIFEHVYTFSYFSFSLPALAS